MTSYLAYPNYFEEDRTYRKNFTRTLNDDESPVHKVILEQRSYLLEIQLQDPNIDINVRNRNFESPLLAAVKTENKDVSYKIIEKLLRKEKIDVNLGDYNGDTPLHEAAKNEPSAEKIIALLLAHPGVDVNVQNCLGETPLHVARTTTAVTMLLDAGADVHRRDNSNNIPLHKQVKDVKISRLLISRGSAVNSQNINGFTALHESAWYNAEDTLDLLLEEGADPNIENDKSRRISALAVSYKAGSSEYIKESLWLRSKPLFLLFPASYDTTKFRVVLDFWNSAISDEELVHFIVSLIGLLRRAHDLNWVTCGRLIGEYFLQKIARINELDCRRIMKKFSGCLKRSMLNFMLKTHDYSRPNSSKEVESVICALLEKGDRLEYSDLEVIFTEFGDCPLLHRLLKRPVYSKSGKYRDLPFFVKALTHLPTNLECSLFNTRLTCTNVMDFHSIHCLARYCTLPPQLIRDFRLSYEYYRRSENPVMDPEYLERVLEEMEKMPKVPSLLEMSRNVVRPYLGRVYKTSRTSDLYEVLERIGLPKILINFIMLDLPLYVHIEPPTYKPYNRHAYLL